MEALFAAVAAYLAIGLDTARKLEIADRRQDPVSQLRIAAAVLAAGLLWPREYWGILKKDWNNYFID